MAREFGKHDLAARIQDCKHAREAKRMSKDISEDDVRWEWEKNNIYVMKNLLLVKAQRCGLFRECLLENRNKLLAEATPSKLWASGLSTYVTENCSPSFWHEQNMLGALLADLSQALLTDNIGNEGNVTATVPWDSQGTIAEEVDKDTIVSEMEAETLNDENITFTQGTLSMTLILKVIPQ